MGSVAAVSQAIPIETARTSHARAGLTRMIHDGSSRKRRVALRDGRVEPGRPEAYLKQYVEGLNGEPARLHAAKSACRLVAAANLRLQ
jgi:hypothetical protein